MNLLACPSCDSTEQLATVERILGTTAVKIEDGYPSVQHHYSTAGTDVAWDSATVIGLTCLGCGWEHIGTDYAKSLVVPEDGA